MIQNIIYMYCEWRVSKSVSAFLPNCNNAFAFIIFFVFCSEYKCFNCEVLSLLMLFFNYIHHRIQFNVILSYIFFPLKMFNSFFFSASSPPSAKEKDFANGKTRLLNTLKIRFRKCNDWCQRHWEFWTFSICSFIHPSILRSLLARVHFVNELNNSD